MEDLEHGLWLPEQEHLQLNEDSVWYGKYVDRVNPDASKIW